MKATHLNENIVSMYHKAILEVYRSDIKTNALIRMEANCICVSNCIKVIRTFLHRKELFWIENSGMLDWKGPPRSTPAGSYVI